MTGTVCPQDIQHAECLSFAGDVLAITQLQDNIKGRKLASFKVDRQLKN